MIRVFVRRNPNLEYLTGDPANELDGLREGPAAWRPDTGGPADVSRTAARLRPSARSHVVGYDLVVAAPRPISIVLALDESRAPGVVRAHRDAVSAAFSYLDERAAVVRDRRGGRDEELASSWQDPVGFTHGVNRHGEPHLHDHVVIPATSRGESRMNDPRALGAHLVTADALYRSTLRARVRELTGYRAWRSLSGREGIEGLDEGWMALWGGHWSERGAKRYWNRDEIVEQWRRQASRMEHFGEMVAPPHYSGVHPHLYRASLYGERWPTRRDIVRALADGAVEGLSGSRVEALADGIFPEFAYDRGLHEQSIPLHEAWTRGPAQSRERIVEVEPSRVSSWSREELSRGARVRDSESLQRGSR